MDCSQTCRNPQCATVMYLDPFTKITHFDSFENSRISVPEPPIPSVLAARPVSSTHLCTRRFLQHIQVAAKLCNCHHSLCWRQNSASWFSKFDLQYFLGQLPHRWQSTVHVRRTPTCQQAYQCCFVLSPVMQQILTSDSAACLALGPPFLPPFGGWSLFFFWYISCFNWRQSRRKLPGFRQANFFSPIHDDRSDRSVDIHPRVSASPVLSSGLHPGNFPGQSSNFQKTWEGSDKS